MTRFVESSGNNRSEVGCAVCGNERWGAMSPDLTLGEHTLTVVE